MRKSYKIPPYGARLTVVRADPDEPLNVALRRHGLPSGGVPEGAGAVAFFDPIGKKKDLARWIVALANRCSSPYYLAHEATHVALDMARWYEIPFQPGLDERADEPIAYLVGHITSLLSKR